jgi:hypothetical protein
LHTGTPKVLPLWLERIIGWRGGVMIRTHAARDAGWGKWVSSASWMILVVRRMMGFWRWIALGKVRSLLIG